MADIKLRTREELTLPDYNYYIFFKIEPNETDVAKIEKSISWERNKWTQGQPVQRRYKELYPDVINVMINNIGFDCATNGYTIDNARELELENAKKIKLGRALKLIRIMSKRGVLFKSELLKMVSSERIQWFTVFDLEREIEPFIEQGVQYIDDTQSIIDFRKYKEVEKYLITVKKADLYEVIGGKPTDSAADLSKYISAVYENMKNKATPEGCATEKLLAIAKIIFKTGESKGKYDDFLKVKNSVFDELELRQSFGIHEIDLGEFLDYAQIIKEKLELYNEKVAIYLGAALKEYKIVISKDNMQ